MPQFHRAAAASEIATGTGKIVVIQGKEIALFNVEGSFHAIDNTCPHQMGPLGEGNLQGNIVTCPWHGWTFEVTTGTCKLNPAAKVDSFPTKIEGGAVFVEI